MMIERGDQRTGVSRIAVAGSAVAAGLSLLCILVAGGWYAYEWVITDGHVADTGHPPLSIYLFMACLYFVPALSLLGLVLGWPARSAASRSRLLKAALAFHVIALLASAVGWMWMMP